jgi:hypothetical protein
MFDILLFPLLLYALSPYVTISLTTLVVGITVSLASFGLLIWSAYD